MKRGEMKVSKDIVHAKWLHLTSSLDGLNGLGLVLH